MKKIIIISIFTAFVFLFLGVALVIAASLNKNAALMYTGLTAIILASVMYTLLLFKGILYFLKQK